MTAPANAAKAPKSLKDRIACCLDGLSYATALILLVMLILLSQIPVIQNGDPPNANEARAALGAMKDRARVIYQRKPGLSELRKEDLELGNSELGGKYFNSRDYTCGGTPEKWWAQCENVFEIEPRHLRIDANLVTGSSSFNR